MGVPSQSLEGIFEHKLDSKYRVSVPSAWRPAQGETVPLRLLKWKHLGVPILRALTNEAFEDMIASIANDPELKPGLKSARKSAIFAGSESALLNDQGKLSIPKKLADQKGLEAGGVAHLFGRGSAFDIVAPRDVEELNAAEEKILEDLYDSVDFG